MADLLSLIRLRKHTVEERQKILSALYRDAEVLQGRKNAMLEQLAHERQLATENNDAGAFYGRYAENMRKKIEKLDEAMNRLNTRIDTAREDVRAAFAEQKKIEIIQRNREQEEREEQQDKESEELDAIAIEGFRRQSEDRSG